MNYQRLVNKLRLKAYNFKDEAKYKKVLKEAKKHLQEQKTKDPEYQQRYAEQQNRIL